ncbi:MAG: hypothetical protein CHACPFDD_00640 [Phycisphaerae bacterium]|nr:hypothetical protein [Phycisphaerae bacterium]
MIHVGALPGTPRAARSIADLARRAVADARLLAAAGFDAAIVENMHDLPYLNGAVGPEIVAAMTAVSQRVRDACPRLRLGVQILAAANREALAVALAAGADFVRVENFVFAHVADEGLMPQAHAGPLLRYRRAIAADHIQIVADLKKKHASHALTADLTIAAASAAAQFAGADAIVITGGATGQPADVDDVADARAALHGELTHAAAALREDRTRAPAAQRGDRAHAAPAMRRDPARAPAATRGGPANVPATIPLYVGSGITSANIAQFWDFADGFIVGSSLKRSGHWSQPLDPRRLRTFMSAVTRLRR